MIRTILIFSFLFIGQSLFSQCYPNRHNTTWYDAWTSCNPTLSPNSARGESHWLHYDLGHFYKLKASTFWNTNQPDSLQNGLKNIVIDYSLDGTSWVEWGTYHISQGTGLNTYEGMAGPDFDEIEARYVLITALDNYGGTCYSLSEIKIEAEETSVTNPPTTCMNNMTLGGTITNTQPTIYSAVDSIISTTTIGDQANVVYKARNQIELKPGFSVLQGGEFTAIIEACEPVTPLVNPENSSRIAPQKQIVNNGLKVTPNPFSNHTLLEVALATEQAITIHLYTGIGQLIRSIATDEKMEAGIHQFTIKRKGLPAGTYFITVQGSDFMQTQKMQLVLGGI